MAIVNGLVTIGTSPTLICASNGPLLLQNLGSAAVTIGGPTVTSGHGPLLPASQTTPSTIPDMGGSANPAGDPVYGVVNSGTTTVAFLTASWDG